MARQRKAQARDPVRAAPAAGYKMMAGGWAGRLAWVAARAWGIWGSCTAQRRAQAARLEQAALAAGCGMTDGALRITVVTLGTWGPCLAQQHMARGLAKRAVAAPRATAARAAAARALS